MFFFLLNLHSVFRWMVLLSLLLAIHRAFRGYRNHRLFSPLDNAIRHWTATISHLQLIIGMLLYLQSPIPRFFFADVGSSIKIPDVSFFSVYHLVLMLGAIAVLTIGSAKAKRRSTDREKFKTMLVWYSIALLLILVAIPWPFSPLANRPYLRFF